MKAKVFFKKIAAFALAGTMVLGSAMVTLADVENADVETFVNEVAWSIIYQEDSNTDPVEYDNSDYCVAGPITDNRNGTVSVKMGKLTDIEILRKQLEEANDGSGPSQGSTSGTVTEEELAEAYTKGVNSI